MKRLLLFLSALMVSISALRAHDVEIDGIYYNIDETNKTAGVTYRGNNDYEYSNEYSGSVTIPETITYNSEIYSVTSIAKTAFTGCSELTEITIPCSVTDIEAIAFLYCDDLTKILVSSNNEKYSSENGVLYNMSKTTLIKYPAGKKDTSFTIPNSVTSIGDHAFYDCSGLTSVTIPNSVTSIGDYAFWGCSGLTKVNYLGTVDKWVEIDFKYSGSNPTRYAKDLYINNELLTDVKITTADSIKHDAFYNCQSIKSVEIGESVTSIDSYTFEGCSGLTSVTIGNSVTSIGVHAFSGCSGLTSVNIPNSVASIGSSAFSGCSGLTSVTIPTSVTSIDSYTFDGCSGLTEILVSSNNDEFSSENGVLYNMSKTTLIKYPAGKKDTSFTIPNSVTSIGDHAFYDCSGLTSVTIPNSVISIGSGAFYDCSGLTSVTIPNSVTTIGSGAFYNTGIYEDESNWDNGVLYIDNCLIKAKRDVVKGSYTIKEGTRIFGSSAFSGCSGLTSVTIPNSVTSIGYEAFYFCSGLTKVNYLGTVDKWVEIDFVYPGANPTRYAKDLYINNELLTDVKITSADSIKNYAFINCKSIKSVEIGNSVTSIGSEAFSDCNSLKTVYNCSSLDIVKGSYTNGCVAYYADEVINACPVVDFIVNYEDKIIEYIGDTTINKIEIPEFVTGIEPDVFTFCANIDTIVWNAINCADFTETTAPFNAQAAQIKSVIFGNNVEYIPAYLCSDMTLLTEISIPGKVNSIGENAFVGCSRLRYITSYPTLVPLAKENSFNSYSAYLYIPCDYYDYYYLDDVFGKFKEIKCISAEEVEGSEKVEIEVDSNNNATIIWPSTGNASNYELVISKNGEVFCTLLFNENGQLTSIDFGNRSASVGFQFTVTGLDGASKYSYSIVAKDEKGNELESYNGTFTTNGYSEETAILETLADANITISDGLITCQDADFTIYNTLGQDVTNLNGALTPGVYVVQVADDFVKVMMK